MGAASANAVILFIVTLLFTILFLSFQSLSFTTKEMANDLIKNKTSVNIVIYLFLICGSVIMLFPFYWMLRTALVDSDSIFEVMPSFIPKTFEFHNFKDALQHSHLADFL